MEMCLKDLFICGGDLCMRGLFQNGFLGIFSCAIKILFEEVIY